MIHKPVHVEASLVPRGGRRGEGVWGGDRHMVSQPGARMRKDYPAPSLCRTIITPMPMMTPRYAKLRTPSTT